MTQHHQVVPTAQELVRDLERFLEDHQEPVESCSVYAQWRVMRAAYEAGITVLLDGQGNDEVLGGWRERVFGDISKFERVLARRVPGYTLLAFSPPHGNYGQASTNDPAIQATSENTAPGRLNAQLVRTGTDTW